MDFLHMCTILLLILYRSFRNIYNPSAPVSPWSWSPAWWHRRQTYGCRQKASPRPCGPRCVASGILSHPGEPSPNHRPWLNGTKWEMAILYISLFILGPMWLRSSRPQALRTGSMAAINQNAYGFTYRGPHYALNGFRCLLKETMYTLGCRINIPFSMQTWPRGRDKHPFKKTRSLKRWTRHWNTGVPKYKAMNLFCSVGLWTIIARGWNCWD